MNLLLRKTTPIQTLPDEVYVIRQFNPSTNTSEYLGYVTTKEEAKSLENLHTGYAVIKKIKEAGEEEEKTMKLNKFIRNDNENFRIVRHEGKIKIQSKSKFLWFTTWNFIDDVEKDEGIDGMIQMKTVDKIFSSVDDAREHINNLKKKKQDSEVQVLEVL